MDEPFRVGNISVPSGEKALGNLVIPDFFADGQALEIPYMIINGVKPGPCLYIQVAQHGSEVMGLDAMRRLILELDPFNMSGTLIYCLPNPLAFRERRRTTLLDPVPGGMNRVWPGDPDGSATERIADLIWTKLVRHATEAIDLHTGERHSPAWVFYEADEVSEKATAETARRSEEMAHLFGAPVLYVETEPYGGRKTLRACCVDKGIPSIVPELSGSGYFDEDIILLAHKGIRNIMVYLGMLEGEIKLPKRQWKLKWTSNSKNYTSIARKGGIFIPDIHLGEVVEKGHELGFIYSPRDFMILEHVKAPRKGYVFYIRENPVVHQGERLVIVPEIIEEIRN